MRFLLYKRISIRVVTMYVGKMKISLDYLKFIVLVKR